MLTAAPRVYPSSLNASCLPSLAQCAKAGMQANVLFGVRFEVAHQTRDHRSDVPITDKALINSSNRHHAARRTSQEQFWCSVKLFERHRAAFD